MRRLLPALLLVTFVAVACSDDESSTTTAAATETTAPAEGTTALCAALDDVRGSIDALTSFDLVTQGTDALSTAVTDIKDSLAALRETASEGLRAKVDAIGAAVDQMQSDVADAGTLVEKGQALFDGLSGVQSTVQDLTSDPEVASCS